MPRRTPGSVRDAIVKYLSSVESASVHEICGALEVELGRVAASSVRSYLNLNVPERFHRLARGKYRLVGGGQP
jgi:hypothetical protein